VLNCPGPVANQESKSRGVVIEIQQKIAGLLRVQGFHDYRPIARRGEDPAAEDLEQR
jgi:hypothetical protein